MYYDPITTPLFLKWGMLTRPMAQPPYVMNGAGELHALDPQAIPTPAVGSASVPAQIPHIDLLQLLPSGEASLEPSDWGWVNLNAHLVGAPRLRQVRVATNSCATDAELQRCDGSDSNFTACSVGCC